MTLSLTGLVLAVFLAVSDIDRQVENYRLAQEKVFISSLRLAAQLSDPKLLTGEACLKGPVNHQVTLREVAPLTSCSVGTLEAVSDNFRGLLRYDMPQLSFPLCLNPDRIEIFSNHCGQIVEAQAVRAKLKSQVYAISVLGTPLSIPAKWIFLLILGWFFASGLYFLFRRAELLDNLQQLTMDEHAELAGGRSYPLWLGEAWLLRPRHNAGKERQFLLRSRTRDSLIRKTMFVLLIFSVLLVSTYAVLVAFVVTDDRRRPLAQSVPSERSLFRAVSKDVSSVVVELNIPREQLTGKALNIEPASDVLFSGESAGTLSFVNVALVRWASLAFWMLGVLTWCFASVLGTAQGDIALDRRRLIAATTFTAAAYTILPSMIWRHDDLTVQGGAGVGTPRGKHVDRSAIFKRIHSATLAKDGLYLSEKGPAVRAYIVEDGWVLFAGHKFKSELTLKANFDQLDLMDIAEDLNFNARIREYALERAVIEYIRSNGVAARGDLAKLRPLRQAAVNYLNKVGGPPGGGSRGFANRLVALRERLQKVEALIADPPRVPFRSRREDRHHIWRQPIFSKPQSKDDQRPDRVRLVRQLDLLTGSYQILKSSGAKVSEVGKVRVL
jgi:hypothetical protein